MLESRHVIGLFMAVIVLSGLFFTLGYVMGRNQTAGQVSADLREKPVQPVIAKPEVVSKKTNKPSPADTPSDSAAPANSDWDFYHARDRKKPEERLKPAASVNTAAPAPAKKTEPLLVKTTATPRATSGSAKNADGKLLPGGSYSLQVAALTKEADALDLAKRLQQKKFPAFVLSPKTDKYFRVQVGPYSDPKAADTARKGLEGAGFKAFVKQN
ncbi:MAG TPA: SPOR domain-containing protein [Candidatus Angelobacter sp.]|nr:SPOR domain-containing protein [Candidatus Angelobacter sp.]